MDCSCSSKMDIVGIRIPRNKYYINDRYDALICANHILKKNGQIKHFKKVIEYWNDYLVDYGCKNNCRYKRLKNGMIIYYV